MEYSEECNMRNYTWVKQDILFVDIGLAYSAEKLLALWNQTWFIILTSGFCFFLSVFILYLNSLVLRHYIRKCRELVPLLYSSISLCDIGNAVSALLTGILLLLIMYNHQNEQDPYPTMSFLVKLTYILFSLTSRVSIFFNTVLVVVRTIHVVFPTYLISRNKVIFVLLAGQALWLCVAALDILGLQHILPYFHAQTYEALGVSRYDVLIDSLVVNPLTGFFILYYVYDKLCNIHNFNVIGIYVLVKGVPFVLPSLVSVVCMLIQTYFLVIRSRVGRHSKVSRRITVTVLYLTLVFVACNIPDFILNLMCLGLFHIPVKDVPLYMCVTFVSSVMLPFVNSLLNPLILLVRGSNLKKSISLCGFGSVRSHRSGIDISKDFETWRSNGAKSNRRNGNEVMKTTRAGRGSRNSSR